VAQRRAVAAVVCQPAPRRQFVRERDDLMAVILRRPLQESAHRRVIFGSQNRWGVVAHS